MVSPAISDAMLREIPVLIRMADDETRKKVKGWAIRQGLLYTPMAFWFPDDLDKLYWMLQNARGVHKID